MFTGLHKHIKTNIPTYSHKQTKYIHSHTHTHTHTHTLKLGIYVRELESTVDHREGENCSIM